MRIKNQMIWSSLLFLGLSMPISLQSSNPTEKDRISNGNLLISFESAVGGNTTYESCSDAYFLIHRNGVLPGQNLFFDIQFTGSASQEIDYSVQELDWGNVYIPANTNFKKIPIDIFNDGLTEGVESLIVSLTGNCSSCSTVNLSLSIYDPLPSIELSDSDTIKVCSTESLTIIPEVLSGYGDLNYLWSDGSTEAIFTSDTPISGIVELIVTDACGYSASMEYIILVEELSATMLSETQTACGNISGTTIPVQFTGPGPYNLLVEFEGDTLELYENITDNPFYFPAKSVGTYSLLSVSGNGCNGSVFGSTKVEIIPFEVSTFAETVTCYGGNDGIASLEVNAGLPPYFIEWETGSNLTSITGLESGFYNLSLVDGNGCVFEDSVFVPENPALAFKYEVLARPSCADSLGGTIAITYECEPYTYEWNVYTDNPMSLTQLEEGVYTVTATNELGCESIVNIDLVGNFTPPNINFNAPDILNCANSVDQISLNGLYTGQNIFSWSTNDGNISGSLGTNSVTVISEGMYSVEVYSLINGCENSDSIFIPEDFNYPDAITTVFDTLDCYMDDLEILGQGSSQGNEYSYYWNTYDGSISGPTNSLNTSVDLGGLYTLSVMDETNGCVTTSDLIVHDDLIAPDAYLDSDGLLTCVDSTVLLSASTPAQGVDFVYSWTSNNGTVFNDSSGLTNTVTTAGLYSFEVMDISNGCVGTVALEVELDNLPPDLSFNYTDLLSCDNETIVIDGSMSAGPNITANWTSPTSTDYILIDDFSIEVADPGLFSVLISNTENGCQEQWELEVTEDYTTGLASIGAADTLDCYTESILLNAASSSQGGGYSYTWIPLDGGNIVDGQGTLLAEVDVAGTYQLIVEYNPSGCISMDTIEVSADINLPSAIIATPDTIDCYQSSSTIEAEVLTDGNFIFSWDANGGASYTMIDSLSLESFGGGMFTLEIYNSDNNCSATFSVEVPIDTLSPAIIMDSDLSINCYQSQTQLDASASSSGPGFQLEWLDNPNLLTDPAQPYMATALTEGMYTLSILNTENGCSSSETYEVLVDSLLPDVTIFSAAELNCETSSIEMFASTGIINNDFSYHWQSNNGAFSSSTDQLSASTEVPGLYTVEVIDIGNGCTSTANHEITQDTVSPLIVLTATNDLNCLTPTAVLDSEGSSFGPSFTYEWSSDIVSFADPLATEQEVNSGGSYSLEILNTENQCTTLSELDLSQNFNTPYPDIDAIGQLDCIQDEVILNANGTILPMQYKVEWLMNGQIISGADGLQLEVSEPGTYDLNITDISSFCKGEESIVIEEDLTLPDLSVMPHSILNCKDSLISLTAVKLKSTYSFLWNTMDGNIIGNADTTIIEVSSAGIYNLTVTDNQNGCKDSLSLSVDADQDLPQLLSSNVPDLNCIDSTVIIQTSVDVEENLVFSWSGPNTGIQGDLDQNLLSVSLAAAYQLQLTNTDNHCENQYVFEVEGDYDLPDFGIEGDLYIDCYEPETELFGMVEQPEKYAFDWQTSLVPGDEPASPEGSSIIVHTPGIYILTLTDLDNGCQATEFIEVEGDIQTPILTGIDGDELNCSQEEVWLEASLPGSSSGLSVNWYSIDGLIQSGQDSLAILASGEGQYFFTVLNPVNGCSSTDSFYVNSNLTLPTFELEEEFVLNCDQSKVETGLISSAVEAAVTWYDAAGTIIGEGQYVPGIVHEGSYSFELTDLSNGCKSGGDFMVLDHRLLDFSYSLTEPVCSEPLGRIEVLNVEGSLAPFTYGLLANEPLGTDNYFGGLESGDYQLIVEDIYGCQISKAVSLSELPDLDISIESQELIELGEAYQVELDLNFDSLEISTIEWTPSLGVSCTNCLEPLLQPDQQQSYHLSVRTSDGCLVERDLMIVVRDDQSVFAPNIFSPDGDGQNDDFRVFASTNYQEVKRFMIYDRWGELVYQEKGLSSADELQGWDGNFSGKTAQVGVYTWFIELLNKQGIWEIHKGDISLYR